MGRLDHVPDDRLAVGEFLVVGAAGGLLGQGRVGDAQGLSGRCRRLPSGKKNELCEHFFRFNK